MTAEENRYGHLSNEISSHGTGIDPQLSVCAQDGLPLETHSGATDPQRRGRATPRSPSGVTSLTVPLAAGRLLGGRYRIERELGEGGMGIVYLAADEQVPGERFAIKVLKENLHPDALTLLREEVRKTRRLSHQNIVDVHSVNVDGDLLYVLMEYLEGKSLNTLLDEEFGRGMRFSHAWPIIEDVGAALSNAHDHNVIHSDVKPANVFLTTSGRTKLLDFGIARVSRGPLLHARVGSRALTPTYASCEMLEGKEADRRDDIYSFACLIYEMLSGERPFGEFTALEARENALQIPPLQGLSREQNAALAHSLAFDREARTNSVEALLAGLGGRTPSRTRPVALLGAAILLAIAAVAMTYLVLDRGRLIGQQVLVEGTTPKAQHAPVLAAAPTNPAASTPLPRSIAVLPFVNMSGDPDQEYFSDGLSEELIDHLVHATNLKVIARTSSFHFKGKNEDVRSIGRELAVTHLLEGSVRKDGQRLRITAQLIRASDGTYMWSHTYDYNLAEIFQVQDEIAAQVSQALSAALPNDYRPESPQPDVRAYNLVLEGDYFKTRRTVSDVRKAAQLYQQAIDLHPDYALAWARLASAYMVEENLTGPPSEQQNKLVTDALDRATQLDPDLAWTYYTRAGFEMTVNWNWAAAQANDERARELDPRFPWLPIAFGDIAFLFGDVDRAMELYQESRTQNPLGPNTLQALSDAQCAAGQLRECLQTRLRLKDLRPEFDGINSSVGFARLDLGQLQAAFDAMQLEPRPDYRLHGLAVVYWALGQHSDSDAALNTLEKEFGSTDPYAIAQVHAYRGEVDDAFKWLDRAYEEHDVGMLSLKTDGLIRNLRGDRRFQALLRRMGLIREQTRGVDPHI
jgi:TolB-like protein/predicted Ser/Thr protein kinase